MLELFNMKHGGTSGLGKKLSTKAFIFSVCTILVLGLVFLGILNYLLNVQYQSGGTSFSKGPVTTPPKTWQLVLEEPQQDMILFSKSLDVLGKTLPAVDVLIFTESTDLVIKSKRDGSFAQKIDLKEGENKITVVVFDSKGDSRSVERIVYYSKEKI